jgi:hypothetical protein
MLKNEIVKGMLLQLAGPVHHYSAVAHSVMQYCESHDFVSLQIHVQGQERRGRRRCQPPVLTATPACRAAAASSIIITSILILLPIIRSKGNMQ